MNTAEALTGNLEVHPGEALEMLREALAMPGASVPDMCESIRTMRQTVVFAEEFRLRRLAARQEVRT